MSFVLFFLSFNKQGYNMEVAYYGLISGTLYGQLHFSHSSWCMEKSLLWIWAKKVPVTEIQEPKPARFHPMESP